MPYALKEAASADDSWLLDLLPDMIAWISRDGTVLGGNRRWRLFLEQHSLPSALGEPYLRYLSKTNHRLDLKRFEHRLATVLYGDTELATFQAGIGSGRPPCWFEVTVTRLNDHPLGGALITHRDLTEKKQLEAELALERRVTSVMLDSVTDGILQTNPSGLIEDMNRAAEKLTGWQLEEARGKSLFEVCQVFGDVGGTRLCDLGQMARAAHGPKAQLHLESRGGRHYAIRLHHARISDRHDKLIGFVFTIANRTRSRQIASELERQARLDPLTELVNRREFRARLEEELGQLESDTEGDRHHALCFLDLDQFKIVNDTCGHIAGDELLRQVARILRQEVRSSDLVGRLGGDEFALLLKNCRMDQAEKIAGTVRQAISNFRFVWDDKFFRVNVSIGVVEITGGMTEVNELLSTADAACYAAKHQGRNRVHVHQCRDRETEHLRGSMNWIARIEKGLEENRFRIFGQQIEPLPSSRHGDRRQVLEMLVRFESQSEGLVSPGVFLPSAERYGVVQRIDEWVLDEVLRQLVAHPSLADRFQMFTLNLSGLSICDEEFVGRIAGKLYATSIPPEKLCFEITETAVISNLTQARQSVSRLRRYGCRFALDDFGGGVCSFSHLRALDVDLVKIDGSFVRRLIDSAVDRTIVQSINDVAHAMGMQTVAEYVESSGLFDQVARIGVDFVQGHALGRAQPLQRYM